MPMNNWQLYVIDYVLCMEMRHRYMAVKGTVYAIVKGTVYTIVKGTVHVYAIAIHVLAVQGDGSNSN